MGYVLAIFRRPGGRIAPPSELMEDLIPSLVQWFSQCDGMIPARPVLVERFGVNVATVWEC